MKTINWQTKALTLFIAAAALWLATACKPWQVERIIPSGSCVNDAALTPSAEFLDLYERWKDEQGLDENTSMEDLAKLPGYWDARNARFARIGPKYEHIVKKIQAEYTERIMRHPFYRGHVFWYLEGERGWLTDTVVLEIDVHKVVSPYRFPPGDRIPECIDGTPVIYFLNRTWATPG